MRVAVDEELCGTVGQCARLAPELFRQRDDGVSEVLVAEPPAEYHAEARLAEIGCPVQAIRLTEREPV